MSATTAPLDHIQEGFAYKHGQALKLYDASDPDAAKAALFKKCLDQSVGPLSIHGCVDLDGPTVSVQVTLLGIQLADCELSPAHQNCTVGGSVDGFKAEIDLSLAENPLGLTVDGQVCAPFVGCESFHKTLPL